jgi:SAM-dependent methyltransferase
MTERRWTVRRVAGGIGRRVPLRPFRLLFPYAVWRPLFRLWLGTVRAQGDHRKAMRELLEIYQDAYVGVDLGAIDYDEGVHAKHRLTHYHDFFVERINESERVLDVGCGKGELAYDIAERAGANVTAIDASPWMLEFARERFAHPRVTYVQADAVDYAPPQPVDVAVLSNVLEHIGPRSELLHALHERAGARRLLVRVPTLDRDWTVPLRREVGLPHFSDPEHKVEYTPELLRAELAEGGWRMGEPQLAWGEIWVEASVEQPSE